MIDSKIRFKYPVSNLSVDALQEKINLFKYKYVNDWEKWLSISTEKKPYVFGSIMRSWQACRPNKMRRTSIDNLHKAPYLEDLIDYTYLSCKKLEKNFNISDSNTFTNDNINLILNLWQYFKENLVYYGKYKGGRASEVGITKSLLLLTNGAVGPAFDKEVKKELNLKIETAEQFIDALYLIQEDIAIFESKNKIKFSESADKYSYLHNGRIYDMILGPKG